MTRYPLFCLECKKLIRPEERTGRSFHKRFRENTERWVYAPVVLGECLRAGYARDTMGWCWRGIMRELRVV